MQDRKGAYSPRLTTMSIIKDALILDGAQFILEDRLVEQYEPTTPLHVDTVEHEYRDGFIPFTDGGYEFTVMYSVDADPSSMPRILHGYADSIKDAADAEFYYEQVEERGSKEEVGEYIRKLLDPDTRIQEDVDEYEEFVREWLADEEIMLRVLVLYYAADNEHSEHPELHGQDHIQVSLALNMDGPYYRERKDIRLGCTKRSECPAFAIVDGQVVDDVQTAICNLLDAVEI